MIFSQPLKISQPSSPLPSALPVNKHTRKPTYTHTLQCTLNPPLPLTQPTSSVQRYLKPHLPLLSHLRLLLLCVFVIHCCSCVCVCVCQDTVNLRSSSLVFFHLMPNTLPMMLHHTELHLKDVSTGHLKMQHVPLCVCL